MSLPWRMSAFVVAVSLLAISHPVLAQTAKAARKSSKAVDTTSGVIVKVDASGGSTKPVRLSINTDAVWRDWVRDQASATAKSIKTADADAAKSVAASGEPISSDSVVIVDVPRDVKLETRYRSSTDEISEGAKTPEKAAAAEAATDPADTSKPAPSKKTEGKPPHFTLGDLQPGLFIEVTSKRVGTRERASLVRVMRPIGGANVPASVETPTDK